MTNLKRNFGPCYFLCLNDSIPTSVNFYHLLIPQLNVYLNKKQKTLLILIKMHKLNYLLI